MSKDDWPEQTEAGAGIEEAYRKGWLPRDAQSKASPPKKRRPKLRGHVRVDFPKGVSGFTAHPEFGGEVYPIFPTQEAVREWLRSKGFHQVSDSPEVWER